MAYFKQLAFNLTGPMDAAAIENRMITSGLTLLSENSVTSEKLYRMVHPKHSGYYLEAKKTLDRVKFKMVQL